jgi:hypothetical protein
VSVVCLLRVLNHYPTAQEAAVYWNEPDGHVWEILTVSYARQIGNGGAVAALRDRQQTAQAV